MSPLVRTVLLISFLAPAASLRAQHAPSPGHTFPSGLWDAIESEPDDLHQADPGWATRMARRRDQRLAAAFGKGEATLSTDHFALPVLLGAYSDLSPKIDKAAFDALLFGTIPTGSMTEYYDEISYGQFALTGNVYGWFTAPEAMAYYAGDHNGRGGTFPRNSRGFVRDIVALADPTVDFSAYDNDGPDGRPNSGDDDGYVDGVMIVYSGAGADWSPGNDNIWAHVSSLGSNAYETDDPAAGGGMIQVNTFAVCPELHGGDEGTVPAKIRPLGVFAHEFGHILGLPDLYDRTDSERGPDFDPSAGVGEWDLMATGSWGGDGRHAEVPSHMSAWSKVQMGWVTPDVVREAAGGFALRSLSEHAEAYLLWADPYEAAQYFLVENRQKTGFDAHLNGDGLLIYHVDELRRWGSALYSVGPVNDDETHKLVDLEAADNRGDLDAEDGPLGNRGDAGDPFPGTTGNTSFTDTSAPNSRDYAGTSTGVAITNISASGATMTFDALPAEPAGYTLAYDEQGITGWGWGFENPTDYWGGVLFAARDAATLNAVDLGFRQDSTRYTVTVYRRFAGNRASDPLATVGGLAPTHGWHTITFPTPVPIAENSLFFVSLKIEGQAYALSFDRYGAQEGRSFASSDGDTWSSDISQYGDLNVRARLGTVAAVDTDAEPGVPAEVVLHASAPNPVSAQASIRFELPTADDVRLDVYDALGRHVATLAEGPHPSGLHTAQWDASGLASGLYVYRLTAGARQHTRSLVVVR